MSESDPPAWFDSGPPPATPREPAPGRGGQQAQQNAIAVPDEADVYEKAQPDQREMMEVLRNSLYPGATWGSIAMVLSYCKVHQLDPLLKCVHIVPMRVKLPGRNNYQWRDVLMPGIADYRVKATRSGEYVGKSEPIFGPMVEYELSGQKISVPEWCKITVRRLVKGIIAEFPAIEYWIENYATGGYDTAAPNSMWNRRSRGQLAKCFDPETEILTDRGFERFENVTGRVLQVGKSGLELTDAKPFCQDYDGEMIVADGTRLNFSVTPNHDMLTTSGKIEAGELYLQATTASDKWFIPRAAGNSRCEAPISDNVLRLAGYYLADGSHTGYHQFRIAVSRHHKIDALRELGLFTAEGIKRDAGRIAITGNRSIMTNFDKVNFTYPFDVIAGLVTPGKVLLPDALLALSQRQARILVDALIEFDGSPNKESESDRTRRLTQTHSEVRRGFELAAVHAGYSVGFPLPRTSDIGGRSFSISVSEAFHFPVVRGVPKNRASLTRRRNVGGKVWCVTVPSSVIVVRRHGFSMLCHQCTEAQALRMAFPEFAIGNTAEEMEGKVLEEYQVVPAATLSEAPTDKLDAFEQLNDKMITREESGQTVDQVLPAEKEVAAMAAASAAEPAEAPPPPSTPDTTERRPAQPGDAPMTAPRLEVDKQALFFRDRIERLPTLERWQEFSANPRFVKWLTDIAEDFPKIREEVLDALAEKKRSL